jgi:hypothetical protein
MTTNTYGIDRPTIQRSEARTHKVWGVPPTVQERFGGTSARKFRPDTITIVIDDGALTYVNVTGFIVKKDGTASVRRGRASWFLPDGKSASELTSLPEWIYPLVQHIPNGG